MEPQRVRKLSIWRPIDGAARERHLRSINEERGRQDPLVNPWLENSKFSFVPRDVSVINKPSKRKRTFTGTFNFNTSSLPASIRKKRILMRLGISVFFAIDLILMIVFIRAIV